nr:eukaryotic translation initiation factor 4 gamma [Quercus suber]
MQQFDPNSGYYQPYGYPYPQYPNQGPPPSPRHGGAYPNPYSGPQGQMGPPYHATDMSRSASQTSQRPPSVSSHGGSQTPAPSSQPPPSSQTPSNAPSAPGASSNFVRPVKKSAIKITDASGKEISFNSKASPSPGAQTPSNAPLIVSTPSASTPPPRAASAQHGRSESKAPTQSAEERKSAFAEQVKRQLEEKRKAEEAAAAKTQTEKDEKTDADKLKAEQAEAAAKAKAAEEAEAAKAKAAANAASAEKAAAQAAKDEEAKKVTEAAEQAASKREPSPTQDEHEETEEERFEREIAEMEAAEKAEEERERAFQEKRKQEKDAAAKKQAEKDASADAELKRQEREAEAREEAREREREAEKNKDTANAEPDEEAKAMFESLAKPGLGPGASAAEGDAETSNTDDKTSASASMPPPATRGAPKPKPAHLKLETNKRVETPEPTPGMQALKSARFLEVKEEVKYPEGISSPNPALNNASARKGRAYDKDFLLQFQSVFKEKPSVDWDQKVRETLGPSDEPSSARVGSARTPSGMTGRTPSSRGAQPGGFPMGHFTNPGPGQQARTLPPGTTSEQRFNNTLAGRGGMAMPGVHRTPSALGMGGPGAIGRSGPMQGIPGMGSPRQQSSRGGKGGSRRGDRTMSKKEEADMANKMPLTAHMEIKGLEKSTTGWKATSLGAAPASVPDLSGHMSPELVQRKVKAALNKMTPEKFEKISDQILEIASQSKTESDGRTLRQVIQLTFEKACDEAHWAGMYAQFCHKMLTAMSSDIRDETITDKTGAAVTGGALFRKYLLNRCQEEFERGWQANLPEKPEGDSQEAALLSDEYYIAAAAKRRGLGLIQFIGQLYKLRMLTIRIMHECVLRLLNFEGEPDESAIENLTTLLKSVGGTMDEEEQGRSLMNTYFQRIDEKILKSDTLASRPRFMVLDLIDLRKASWKGKNDGSKGPKTLDEIHAEAAAAQAKAEQERQRTSHRGGHGGRMPQGRGDARNFSGNMPPPVDHNKTTVGMEDLRRLQNRGSSQRQTGGNLGPGGSLGTLGPRSGSRRGIGPQSSGNTTRTNTPPVDAKDKKEEPSAQQNAFSALAQLDSGEGGEESTEAASPSSTRVADKAEDNA